MRKLFWLLPLALLISGCALFQKPTTIYPIMDDDIYSAPVGTVISIPKGTVVKDEKGNVLESYPDGKVGTVQKTSWVVSDFYLQEVVDAKVKRHKK